MKIAFDHQTFVLQPYGGIPRYFTQLAQGLVNHGQEVGVFAPLYQNSYLAVLPKEIVHGRHIQRYPPKIGGLFLKYNEVKSHAQIARWKPDLVHETYYSRVGAAPLGCPTVITVYDMIHELFPNDFLVRDNTATIKRIAVDRADHVICISENTKMDLMRLYGTPASKLSVVHLGFDQFAPRAVKQQLTTLADRPFLLYVGARGGYKNFIGFLRAVASSKRLLSDFDIVAFGGSKFSTKELNEMSSLGFRENQIRHQSGSDDVLGRFYSSAKAFVYPSLYEGFGIPPLEAMAHQCPVISSNTSSMPEVIGKAGEYFDPADTDDMRRAIEDVVYSVSRVNQLLRFGEERLTAFSWDKCARETFDIYRSLI